MARSGPHDPLDGLKTHTHWWKKLLSIPSFSQEEAFGQLASQRVETGKGHQDYCLTHAQKFSAHVYSTFRHQDGSSCVETALPSDHVLSALYPGSPAVLPEHFLEACERYV